MIWIIGFIVLVIIGSLSSSTSTSSKSNTSSNNRSHRNQNRISNTVSSLKESNVVTQEMKKVAIPVEIKEETYEERHRRINNAIEERKKIEALEKAKIEISIKNAKQLSESVKETQPLEKSDTNDQAHLFKNIQTSTEINNNEGELDYEKYVSTTKLGKIFGINARPELFDYLTEIELLTYENKKFVLTEKGKNYGGYRTTKEMDGQFVVWNIEKISPQLNVLLKNKLQYFENFYHLTHVSNIEGIFERGLYCHSAKPEYRDVSNIDVNQRREKTEKCHGKKIHDYVPFYFNVRNAMLYAVQKKVGVSVVVLEMDKIAACLPYTIFSDRNAATVDAQITNIKEDLKLYNWEGINSESWTENGIQNTSRMQLMMAECLIL